MNETSKISQPAYRFDPQIRFVFTCGCQYSELNRENPNSPRICPEHSKRSLKEIVAFCVMCGVEVVFRPGQYHSNNVPMCRTHKNIREKYVSYVKYMRAKKIKPIEFEQYLERSNKKKY